MVALLLQEGNRRPMAYKRPHPGYRFSSLCRGGIQCASCTISTLRVRCCADVWSRAAIHCGPGSFSLFHLQRRGAARVKAMIRGLGLATMRVSWSTAVWKQGSAVCLRWRWGGPRHPWLRCALAKRPCKGTWMGASQPVHAAVDHLLRCGVRGGVLPWFAQAS